MEDGLREDLKLQKLLDGLNDVEISKRVLGCLDTCYHPDEGQFFITILCMIKVFSVQRFTMMILYDYLVVLLPISCTFTLLSMEILPVTLFSNYS